MGDKKDIIGGRDTMKKGKFVMSIILVFALIISQINTCYGSNDILSAEQMEEVFSLTCSVVDSMKSMGFSLEDCSVLFSLSATEAVEKTNNSMINETVLYDYDGNPPESDEEQLRRIQNVMKIAAKYYNTKYYEGKKGTYVDYGTYLFYLYISNYIDGPGAPPTDRYLPHIITTSDVTAYSKFIREQNMTNDVNAFINFANYISSVAGFTNDVLNIKGLTDYLGNIKKIIDGISIATSYPEIKKMTVHYAMKYINEHDLSQIKDDELEGVLADYIFQNLNKFYELENFDINNVKTLSETVAAGISTILGGEFTLLNVVFLIGPMFRYTFSSFIKQTSLVVLGTSLNGRYIDRMMIDEDL